MQSHRSVVHAPPAASASSPHPSSASIALAIKARFWDRIARKYAKDPIADIPGYEFTLQRVQSLLSPDHDVLELGCGTGSTALRLAPHTRQFLATDVSQEMLAIAREKLAAQPTKQLRFAHADADQPTFGHATWDVVLAFNVLHLVAELDRAVDVVMQALKPGGLFISKTACLNEMHPLIPRVGLPLMRMIGKAPHVLCLDAAHLQGAMVRRGLVIEAVERHGTRGKDARVFIVARKPSDAPAADGGARLMPKSPTVSAWPR